MWRSQNFNARNFSEISYLCENPLFATYPCVTNPLFDELSMYSSECIVECGCDAPLDNGPHESSLLQSSPDGSLESCPVLAICNVVRKQEIYCPWGLIKDISEKPQSMESIENPLFASFPCVTNPLFDSQDLFEKGFVDDVVGALEALKLEAHDEERTPYVTARFPKAMSDYMTDSDSVGWAIPCASRDMVYFADSSKLPDLLSYQLDITVDLDVSLVDHCCTNSSSLVPIRTKESTTQVKGKKLKQLTLDGFFKDHAQERSQRTSSLSEVLRSDQKELDGKGLQGNQFTPYILESLPIESEPPTRKNGHEERAMLHNSMILIRDENFCFKSLRRFHCTVVPFLTLHFFGLID